MWKIYISNIFHLKSNFAYFIKKIRTQHSTTYPHFEFSRLKYYFIENVKIPH